MKIPRKGVLVYYPFGELIEGQNRPYKIEYS